MQICPVCEAVFLGPLPPFCERCAWDLKSDLTLMFSISDIPDVVIEEYRRRLATARQNWSEKAEMAKKLRELERRLDESEKRKKEEKVELEKDLKESLAKERQQKEAVSNWTEPITGMEFVLVRGGTFMMGDVFGDGRDNEKPVHEVTLDNFYIGKFPVTQGQWKKVMEKNPSRFEKGDDYPVESIFWHDAMSFIATLQELNVHEIIFSLPTEAQWEYAARSGGKREKYAGGEDVDALAWYGDNSGGRRHPVGRKKPNGIGLHDMSGNIWEWCRGYYGNYQPDAVKNPLGPSAGVYRVIRGGSWVSEAGDCRTAIRVRVDPGYRLHGYGFRLALRPGQH